mgnify:CR=1 FL=1
MLRRYSVTDDGVYEKDSFDRYVLKIINKVTMLRILLYIKPFLRH